MSKLHPQILLIEDNEADIRLIRELISESDWDCEVLSARDLSLGENVLYREGHLWLAEVPLFEAVTRGRTRAEALEMIADWFEAMIDRASFSVRVHPGGNREFEVSSPDLRSMISLLLQRRRKASGLSVAETARRLGVKSRNAYARYERGESLPTIEKLDRLLRAVSEGREVVVAESSSWTSSRQSHNSSKHMSEPLKVSASRAIR